jgi:peptidoglycan/xylan/chitin deacetylase (PgdA/CDA1 family)
VVPLTRRALLRASAAAAFTAACSPGSGDNGSPTPGSVTPSPSRASASAGAAGQSTTSARPARKLAVEVAHGARTSDKVALTFHGAGAVSLATRLLAVLERRNVHGTVMAVGTWLQAEPRMARRITGAGHELGNHTLHHYPMRDLGPQTAYDEIERCARVLAHVSNTDRKWFRASGTQTTTPTIRRAAARAGYDRCISYDVDGLDWQDPSAATVVRAVLDGAKGGSIVSLHLGHPVTVDALPDVLDGLHSQGLQPVTLTELLG